MAVENDVGGRVGVAGSARVVLRVCLDPVRDGEGC